MVDNVCPLSKLAIFSIKIPYFSIFFLIEYFFKFFICGLFIEKNFFFLLFFLVKILYSKLFFIVSEVLGELIVSEVLGELIVSEVLGELIVFLIKGLVEGLNLFCIKFINLFILPFFL